MDFQIYKKTLGEWAADQHPVFIVGPERSGTSLLFQQVSNHPAFCDFSHATVETFCFVKPWLLLKPSCPENYEMRVYLGQKNLPAFQESIHQCRRCAFVAAPGPQDSARAHQALAFEESHRSAAWCSA